MEFGELHPLTLAFRSRLFVLQFADLRFPLAPGAGVYLVNFRQSLVIEQERHKSEQLQLNNSASRMESHGLPGQVQITEAARELLQRDFLCRHRGRISVKGIGLMDTWLLLGRREHGA